jgi:chromosome segregation protein
LRKLALGLAARRFLELEARGRKLSGEASGRRQELTDLIAQATKAELEAETLKLAETEAASRLEDEFAAWHQMNAAYQQQKLEETHLREARESALQRAEKARTELSGLEEGRARMEEEAKAIQDSLTSLEEKCRTATEQRDEIREEFLVRKSASDALIEARDEAARRLWQARDDLARLGETLAGAESLAQHLTSRRRELELDFNQSDQQITEAKERLAARERFKKSLAEDLSAAEEEIADLREEARTRRSHLESLIQETSQAESKAAALEARLETLDDMKAGFAWYPQGVKALMSAPELLEAGLLGPLAERLNLPKGFEGAAEAALGERLAFLLTKDRAAAILALRYAKERNLGRCAFLSLEDLEKGDLEKALLGDFSLAENLDQALAGNAKKNQIFLTKEGEYLGQFLLALGGQADPKEGQGQGLLARLKETEEAGIQRDEFQKTLASLRERVTRAREELLLAEESLSVKTSEINGLSASLSEATSKIMVAESEVKGFSIRQSSLEAEMARVEKEATEALLRKDQAAENKDSLSQTASQMAENYEQARKEAEEAALEIEELKERGQAAASAAQSAADQLETAGRERKRVRDWLETLDSRREDLSQEAEQQERSAEDILSRLEKISQELAGAPERLKEAEKKVATMREDRESGRERIALQEIAAKEARKSREEAMAQLNAMEKDLMEASFGLSQLKENLLKDWRVRFGEEPEIQEEITEEIPEKLPEEPSAKGQADEPAGDKVPGQEISLAGTLAEDIPEDLSEASLEPDKEAAYDPDVETGPERLEEEDGQDSPPTGEPLPMESQEGEEKEPPAISPYAETEEPLADQEKEPVALAPPEWLDPEEWAALELPEDAESQAERLKERLEAMGEVSLASIDEENKLSERYGFQKSQYDDLIQAMTDLRDGINRINQTCRERFNETFRRADEKFREIFPVLFDGGEGWLGLSNPDDPLESGVEIRVHPPGKKIMLMSLLSGGEKALTALALIFALYLIKPSPFCLLDEADAPLDEANIDRFNRLLRRLSQASQIIMVTHNKRTMQISDTLYGVTMESPGVSRLVSVNLAEAEGLTEDA